MSADVAVWCPVKVGRKLLTAAVQQSMAALPVQRIAIANDAVCAHPHPPLFLHVWTLQQQLAM